MNYIIENFVGFLVLGISLILNAYLITRSNLDKENKNNWDLSEENHQIKEKFYDLRDFYKALKESIMEENQNITNIVGDYKKGIIENNLEEEIIDAIKSYNKEIDHFTVEEENKLYLRNI
jgi:hypothetical protein